MELVPAGVPLTFEVTYDRGDLNVALSVYDTTGGTPELVQGPTAMDRVAVGLNTYFGRFTPLENRSYVLLKAVYTTDEFETFDDNYGQGSESIFAQLFKAPLPDGVVGSIYNGTPLMGEVV